MLGAWTCHRKIKGITCKTKNPNRNQKCSVCYGKKPRRKKPEHMKALELPYESYVILNGGEFCAICGKKPSEKRRLDRDHCHKTGKPRGLLCHRCNRTLVGWMTPAWLIAAAKYLEERG